MKQIILKSFLFFLLLIKGQIWAQTYPVMASVHLKPPYSLFLSDYTISGTDKMSVHIFLRDLSRQNYKVKLRLTITGSSVELRTKENFTPQPIFLQGGLSEIISGSDLAPYLDPNNLDFSGITKEAYGRKNKLPEDSYMIRVEVVDYDRNIIVSNTAITMAWLILNDPPIINRPEQGEKLRAVDPQQIVFQWTPRHTGSPNSAFTVQYEFSLVEMWPTSRNPNDAMNTSVPLFKTILSQSTFVYGPSEPLLIPGRPYAFRVRAVDTEERDLFKNNGYSEVHTFIYGDECLLPSTVGAEAINPESIKIAWTAAQGQTAFMVSYREKTNSSSWFKEEAVTTYRNITSLKPSTTYEYHVQAKCGTVMGGYSNLQTITTPERTPSNFTCGTELAKFTLNTTLKAALSPGDVIMAGDFDVKLSTVTGGSGIFSGEGLVVVPMMNHMKVRTSFTNIKVNEENRMIQGKIRIIGGTAQLLDDDTRGKINNVVAQVNNAFETANQYLDRAEDIQNKATQAIATIENLPAEVDKILAQSNSLIDQGKKLLAEGKTSEGQSLLEQGAQAIQKGMDKVAELTKGVSEYANRFKEMVEQALNNAKDKSTADAESLNKEKDVREEEYEKLRDEYNAEREGLLPAEGETAADYSSVIVFEVSPDKNGYEVENLYDDLTKLANAYQEAEAKIRDITLIVTHIQELIKPENLQAFVKDVEDNAKTLADGLWDQFIQGKITDSKALEDYVKSYVEKYLEKKLEELKAK